MPLTAYADHLRQHLEHGRATEPTHRTAMGTLLEALGEGIQAVNEPRAIECGAPDFLVRASGVPVGHVECKDIGADLKAVAKSDQLKRYLRALPNLILTDYLEFHWYVEGARRETATLGHLEDGRLRTTQEGRQAVEALLRRFLAQVLPTIGAPRQLAEMLAAQAALVKDAILHAYERETEHGPLHGYLADFRRRLLPDLRPDAFADMYAQTLAYGLFSAWANRPAGEQFTRDGAYRHLPATNPFLRQVLHSMMGPGLPDEVSWAVDRVVDILNHTDRAAVMEGFGDGHALEDPVIHFYETFLAAYDPTLRERRGVYYTPEPVVSYIVRSVDHILKTRFDLPDGLADTATIQIEETDPETGKTRAVAYPKVLILDPACGTGTFLHYVIRHIYRHQAAKGEQGAWPDYVREHLLPRLFGFELLMAPYTMAHMKLAHCLQEETGYAFQGDERINVFLTNALEPGAGPQPGISGLGYFIAEEAQAAAEVKQDKPIMVVLGNPPYSNFGSMNSQQWIMDQLAEYKRGLDERKLNWDDYMKLVRFAQLRIERTGHGVLAFVTNSSYLDTVSRRQMRASILETFDRIFVLDLHGNVVKSEVCPDGSPDKGVFDIQQGTAITLMSRSPGGKEQPTVSHADLWGTRPDKEAFLRSESVETTDWTVLQDISRETCLGRMHFFVPRGFDNIGEYCGYPSVPEVFLAAGPGMKAERDKIAIHFDRTSLQRTLQDLGEMDVEAFRVKYSLGADSRDWTVAGAKADVLARLGDPGLIRPLLYRPFDLRWTWYSGRTRGFIGTPGRPTMQNLTGPPNLALCTMRQSVYPSFQHVLASQCINSLGVLVTHHASQKTFPLYLYPEEGSMDEGRRPNLAPEFIADFSARLGLEFVPDGRGDLAATFGPEDVFDYAYAIFHSPTYRARYAEFLKIDFPRLPLTSNVDLFRALVGLGGELVRHHLLEGVQPDPALARFEVGGSNEVERVRYDEARQRVFINKTQHFAPVPPELYGFYVGGYRPLDKWLKDRKGRKLSADEVTHYRKVAVALRQTMRLMGEIDAAIPGWPVE